MGYSHLSLPLLERVRVKEPGSDRWDSNPLFQAGNLACIHKHFGHMEPGGRIELPFLVYETSALPTELCGRGGPPRI